MGAVIRAALVAALAAALAADARRRYARLGRDHEARDYIAAWVADQYLLDRGPAARRELDRLVNRRVVSTAFRTRLLKRLRKYGY